jgi:hypothetical protein
MTDEDRSAYDRKRDSEGRLAAILRSIPEPYPKRVLDLGAHSGFMACALAREWGCEVLAIERHGPGEQYPGVRWLSEDVSASRLRELCSDGFDLALALSVLHHMPDWAAAYWALRSGARYLVAEATHRDEGRPKSEPQRSELVHDLVTSQGRVIHRAPAFGMADKLRPLVIAERRETPPGARGTVISGKGSVAPAMPKFRGLVEALGYQPYPGSLNVLTEDKSFAPSGPYTTCESRFGTYKFWPARVSGISCHVFHSPNGRNSPGFVEIVAAVRLRKALAVEDGGAVWVELC